jgi:hypothetical protein
VTPEIQGLLVQTLQDLREPGPQPAGRRREAFVHADGVIFGLEEIGAITAAEGKAWRTRVWELQADSKRKPHAVTNARRPRQVSRVERVILGPPEAQPFLDGWLRIVAVELFPQFVRVHWNLGPTPSYEALLGDDLAEVDRDTEGLPGEERENQRYRARALRFYRLFQPTLSDDLGTKYRSPRARSAGPMERDEETGITDFTPSMPSEASSLEIKVLDCRIVVPVGRLPRQTTRRD